MASEGAVGVVLVIENPLAGDDVSAGWSRNKPPGSVVDERLVLLSGTTIRGTLIAVLKSP